jgi:tetratricopeptide (TPR) repeat protein
VADLGSLYWCVDKSLLRFGEERFWMLETIREYAGELLEASTEAKHVGRRHAEHILGLARLLEGTSGSSAASRTFLREHDNFRGALVWARRERETDLELDLAGTGWPFWWYRGSPAEGLAWVESALAHGDGGPAERRAKALAAGAMFAYRSGDLERMNALAEEGLEVARASGDSQSHAWSLVFLGIGASEAGDCDGARRWYDEAAKAATGDRRLEAIIANNLGVVATMEGKTEEALVHAEAALEISRALDVTDETSMFMLNFADSLTRAGRLDEARDVAREALLLARDGRNPVAVLDALPLVAALADSAGRPEVCALLVGATSALRTPLGVPYVEAVQVDALEDISSRLIESLGPRAYHERYREGARMTFDEAVFCALEELEASGK